MPATRGPEAHCAQRISGGGWGRGDPETKQLGAQRPRGQCLMGPATLGPGGRLEGGMGPRAKSSLRRDVSCSRKKKTQSWQHGVSAGVAKHVNLMMMEHAYTTNQGKLGGPGYNAGEDCVAIGARGIGSRILIHLTFHHVAVCLIMVHQEFHCPTRGHAVVAKGRRRVLAKGRRRVQALLPQTSNFKCRRFKRNWWSLN